MATEAAPAATAVPAAPSAASRGPTLTPLPPAPPVQPGGRFTQVKIYLIALNDNGRSGPQVGCGDSAIPVVRQITPTNAPLTAAIKELLSLHDRDYGESGLYNALYQSRLQVSSVAIMNGVATIRLTGQLLQGGECDSPRIGAQLTNTALQFSTVRSVQVFINGVPLQTLLSGR
jgi:spore germination protein GerM